MGAKKRFVWVRGRRRANKSESDVELLRTFPFGDPNAVIINRWMKGLTHLGFVEIPPNELSLVEPENWVTVVVTIRRIGRVAPQVPKYGQPKRGD